MKRTIESALPILRQVKQAARHAFAWPGGYPLAVILEDGEAICPKCARAEYRQIAWSTIVGDHGGWAALGAQICEGEQHEACCHCGTTIAEERAGE